MRNRIVSAAAAFLLLIYSVPGYGMDCSTICKGVDDVMKGLDINHVIVDANTGELSRQRFGETTDRVQVVFVKKNPFKYKYKFSVVSKPLDQGIIEGGLKLLGITLPGDVQPVPQGMDCSEDHAEFDDAVAAVDTAEDALNEALKPLTDAGEKYDEFAQLVSSDAVECNTVCGPAKALLPELDTLLAGVQPAQSALDTLKKAIQAAKDARAGLEGRINKIADQDQRNRCLQGVEPKFSSVTEVEDKLAQYKDTLDKIAANKARFQQLKEIIESLAPSSFVEVADAFSAGGATDVTISIARHEFSTDKDRPDIVRHLQFGESPFSISAGLGWTSIEAPRIIRQRAPKPDSETEIIEVFGEENNSNVQPMLIGQLNARLGPKFMLAGRFPAAVGISAGTVLADTTDTMDNAYHAGLSLILANNSFVLTLAYHSAVVSHLAPGFEVGDPIPSTVQDPLPQEKDREGGVMLAITYRTR